LRAQVLDNTAASLDAYHRRASRRATVACAGRGPEARVAADAPAVSPFCLRPRSFLRRNLPEAEVSGEALAKARAPRSAEPRRRPQQR